MIQLRIAERVRLPLDWMTLATVVYGARGSGKTTLGAVVAEEVSKAGQRFCAIDLKGDWYGLKSSADGATAGIPAVIFGGDHKDLPLEEGAGAEVAEIVASLEQSTILDLEYFSKGKQVKFLAAFFERLYDRNREPLVLLLDEAQRYAPQKPISPEATLCLSYVEDLVKLGRKHGIGPVLFTQRGSGLNKEVSELCDMLVAFRTPGPLDQDRIKDWLDANTTKAQRDEVMGQLSGLPTGTAVFASGHPDLKVFQVAQVRRRETFDSSATPKVGQRRKEPKQLAKPDLEALQARMASAIERAKQDDPKELRRRIVELERAARSQKPAAAAAPIEKEVPVLRDAQLKRLESVSTKLVQFGERLFELNNAVVSVGQEITTALARINQPINGHSQPAPQLAAAPSRTTARVAPPHPVTARPAPAPTRATTRETLVRGGGSEGERRPLRTGALRMLEAVASRYPVSTTEGQMAQLAKFTRSGGTFKTYLSDLRIGGYILERGDDIELTDAGWDAIGQVPGSAAPQTTEDVLQMYAGILRTGPKRMLEYLIEAYPSKISQEELGTATNYAASGGTFKTYLSDLRKAGLVEEQGAMVGASEYLMNPAAAGA